MKKKIALLCDYGLDDALATLYVLRHAHMFSQIDILPVAGNFPLEMCMHNAKRLLSHMPSVPENVVLVDTSVIQQHGDSIPEIHGKDGMGDVLGEEEHYGGKILDYTTWIESLDESYVIVSLGPCTVTLEILKKKKDLPVLMMGGNIAERPNYKAYEFNHGIDPVAFSQCVKYDHLVATLDTCHCHQCDMNHIKIVGDGLFAQLARRYLEMSRNRKEQGCYVYDLTAAVYLLHPDRFRHSIRQDSFGNKLSVLEYIEEAPIIQEEDF